MPCLGMFLCVLLSIPILEVANSIEEEECELIDESEPYQSKDRKTGSGKASQGVSYQLALIERL